MSEASKTVKVEAKVENKGEAKSTTNLVFSDSGHLKCVSELAVKADADEAWKIVGVWEPTFLMAAVKASSDGKSRVVTVADVPDLEIVETLVERNDKERFYSFSICCKSVAVVPYVDQVSKLSVVKTGDKQSKIVLETTFVPLIDEKECFEAVQMGQDQTLEVYAEQVNLRCK
jgi:hypothetical protein